jgi:hypothetical protein
MLGCLTTQIPTLLNGCQAHIDFSDQGYIQQSGGLIARVVDKSGNRMDAVQGTVGNQPALATLTIGGKPMTVGRFNGTTSRMDIPNGANILVCPSTVFIVSRPNASMPSSGAILRKDDTGSPVGCLLVDYTSSNQVAMTVRNGTAPNNPVSVISRAVALEEITIFEGRWGVDVVTAIQLNGTQTNSATVVTLQTPRAYIPSIGYRNVSGGLTYLNGDIGEIIIYNRILSTAESNLIKTYLANKWGVGVV